MTTRSFVLVACDTLLIALAVVVAAYVRLGYLGARDVLVIENGAAKALLIAFVSQTCLYYADLYDLRHLADRRELFTRILQALSSGNVVPTVQLHEQTHLPLAAFQAALKELVAEGLAQRATGGLVSTDAGREMIQDFALS